MPARMTGRSDSPSQPRLHASCRLLRGSRTMRKIRPLSLATIVLGLTVGALSMPVSAQAGGTLRIARDEDAVTFDPMNTILNSDIWVLDNMNASLVRVTPDGTKLEPDLAEKWTIS